MNALTDRAETRMGLRDLLRPRTIWRRYLVYNRLGMAALGAFNRLRWLSVDIPVVLWPPARELFDAIEQDIRTRHRIVEATDYRVEAAQFGEFVQKIYAIDSASPAKIDIKLGHLVRPPLVVRVLTVRFRWPHMEVQDILNRVRCKDAHRLKEQIRVDYRDRVADYIFDILVHSTETAAQGKDLMKLLRTYGPPA